MAGHFVLAREAVSNLNTRNDFPRFNFTSAVGAVATLLLTRMIRFLAFILIGLLTVAERAYALGQVEYVTAEPGAGSFPLYREGTVAAVSVDPNDFTGVIRAAGDLVSDIHQVTGRRPEWLRGQTGLPPRVIIVGTLGKCALLDRLVREHKLNVQKIAGQWESFLIQVVAQPCAGVDQALVIGGSDQRGTIYGIYDLSEELGVSPWHYWADVPARKRNTAWVKAGPVVQGPPAVKYRGIFLNDEAPDLTGWANHTFGGYNHAFYTNVFELLLRLKANYLWPAMWNNCFNEDDPLNPQLAGAYGIVMGTSHVEPMMRADKEWNRLGYTAKDWNFAANPDRLKAFWEAGLARNRPYENIITMAMRGKIDTPMSAGANITLLEQIVAAQRELVARVYGTNAAAVPQLWALYKEVQEYYEKGMRVPDDLTLLWCDDNWGNLRRLPAANERGRAGGSGIYYHFDYVGNPRNYKWVNTSPLPKIGEQMNLAYHYGADRIWIVNVGHLQHVALPTEFFLSLAWSPERWPKERVAEFTRQWAAREFGGDYAAAIADVVTRYGWLTGRRKPELLAPDTYSIVNYGEADRVLAEWQTLAGETDSINKQLPAAAQAAFFELVRYPVLACANLHELYVTVAKNRLYAAQGRASANDLAARARELFRRDAKLAAEYNHQLAGGKWNHMMDQTHIGYTSWQQPDRNVMPAVATVRVAGPAALGVAVEGSAGSWSAGVAAALPPIDRFRRPARYVEIFNRGAGTLAFSATAAAPWILLSQPGGVVTNDQRIGVTVDWAKAPAGAARGWLTIRGGGTNAVAVAVDLFNPPWPPLEKFDGFVETEGCVAMAAEHFTQATPAGAGQWEKVPGLGHTRAGMEVFPVTAASAPPPLPAPVLEYKMYLFHAGPVSVEAELAPTLNFVAGRGLRFGLSFDDQPVQVVTAVPENYAVGDGAADWAQTVKDGVRRVRCQCQVTAPGEHTLKFRMVDPGVVLERLVVDTGGVKPSYLGPPESFRGGERFP